MIGEKKKSQTNDSTCTWMCYFMMHVISWVCDLCSFSQDEQNTALMQYIRGKVNSIERETDR